MSRAEKLREKFLEAVSRTLDWNLGVDYSRYAFFVEEDEGEYELTSGFDAFDRRVAVTADAFFKGPEIQGIVVVTSVDRRMVSSIVEEEGVSEDLIESARRRVGGMARNIREELEKGGL